MKIVSYLLLLLILIIGISFACLNSTVVTVNYYIGLFSLPLSLLIVITFVMGCILGLLVGITMYLRLKSQNFRLKNRINLVEKEISNLRTMPLQDNR